MILIHAGVEPNQGSGLEDRVAPNVLFNVLGVAPIEPQEYGQYIRLPSARQVNRQLMQSSTRLRAESPLRVARSFSLHLA